jgi:acyl-CoA dehydrogenase
MIPPAGITPGKKNLFYNDSHHAWRKELKKFVAKEIAPFVETWEEAGEFPRELYKKAGDFGLLGMGYPEKYGGTFEGIDIFHGIVTSEELAQGSGGIAASLFISKYFIAPNSCAWNRRTKRKIYYSSYCWR